MVKEPEIARASLKSSWKAVVAVLAVAAAVSSSGRAAPANDNFANRINLTGSDVSTVGNNTYATRESGEPTQGVRSIWWSWTAPTSGTYTVTASVENFVPYLFVYTGTELTNLTLLASDVGGDIDWTAQVVLQAAEGTSYSLAVTTYAGGEGNVFLTLVHANPPNVTVIAPTNGATIYANEETVLRANVSDADGDVVRVEFYAYWLGAMRFLGAATNAPYEARYNFYYYFGDGGPQSARVQARASDATGITAESSLMQYWVTYPPPPNDAFSNRLAISGSFFTVPGNNLYASRESDDPTPGRQSVWWVWTAPTSGVYTVSAVAFDGAFVPFLGVYSGSDLANLSPVGTATGSVSDTAYSASVPVDAVSGNTYAIAVSAVSGFAGEIRLCISPPTAPDTAEFEAITAEAWPPGVLKDAVTLHLWFRTGSGSRWWVEASTNLITWQGISHQFLPNCRMDFITSNVRERWVSPYYYEQYVLPRLYFRLVSTPSPAPSESTMGAHQSVPQKDVE